ncbi:MAG: 4-hydroxy-tetrahydrodipicolinate reductase [Kiloniellaceae bacterium]
MLRVCVSGATGWTGREVALGVLEADDMALAGAVARRVAGRDIGTVLGRAAAGVPVAESLDEALAGPCDVLIDYTHPSVGKAHALAAIEREVAVVLGTTGLSAADFAEIDAAARAAGVAVATGNFCLTAALLQHFALFAARHVERFEVVDYAGPTKPDAPSGTATELAELLGEVRRPTIDLPVAETHGPREARGASIGGVQVHSLRLPSYTLAVEAIFARPGERLVLRHEAGTSAQPYVAGTLLAARKVREMTGLVRGLDKLLFGEGCRA